MNFSEGYITWFQSYFSERIFVISKENQLSEYGRILCNLPQGSILRPFLFLIYVNDMPQAVKLNLCLYDGDSYLMFQHKDVEDIEQVLNNESIYEWQINLSLKVFMNGK